MVPGRPLRPVESRRVGNGPRRRRLPRSSRGGVSVAGRHAATRRFVARLLPRRRIDRGREARHQRVRLHRHRGHPPPPDDLGRDVRRTDVADGRTGARVRARPPSRRRAAAVGGRGRCPTVGLRPRHRYLQHPARTSLRRPTRRARRRRPAEMDRGSRRHGRCGPNPTGRFRAEDPVGDGLVLPGADRGAHRRSSQGSARRGLGDLRHGGSRDSLRERRTVDHRIGDSRVRTRLRIDR